MIGIGTAHSIFFPHFTVPIFIFALQADVCLPLFLLQRGTRFLAGMVNKDQHFNRLRIERYIY